jgi:hypothetical protein
LFVIVLPFALMWGFEQRLVPVLLVGGLALSLAGLLFLHLQPALHNCPLTAERWTRQALISAGFSIMAWLSLGVINLGGLKE